MGSLRNNLPSFTSFGAVKEAEISQMPKHGITSILESDDRRNKSTLRKTLSADMSSKRWKAQNGVSSILADENNNKKSMDFSEVWSSILTQKTSEETRSASLPPYIPPLVKRAAHSLSYQSLQICTESLGSETGFDGNKSCIRSETGFDGNKSSSEPPSDAEDDLEEELDQHKQESVTQSSIIENSDQHKQESMTENSHEKYSRGLTMKTVPQSFPPPLRSLSCQDRGSLHLRKCRQRGRIVLEAISIPPQNNFQAQREDGCLILTFVNRTSFDSEASNDHGKILKQDKDFIEPTDVNELINSESNDEDFDITHVEDEEQEEEEEVENYNVYSKSFRDDSCQVVKIESDDREQIQIPRSLPSQPFLTRTTPKQPACLTVSSYKDECMLFAESQGVNNITNTSIQQSPGHEHCSGKCIIATSPMSTWQKELLSAKQAIPCCFATSLNSCREPKRPPLYSDLKWISIS